MQRRRTTRDAERSDAPDQISLHALARKRNDGVERVVAECLLHLPEQRVEALDRLYDVARVRAWRRFDVGERHTGRPLVRGTDLLEREWRHRLEAVLAFEFHEPAHRGSQAAVALLDAWRRKVPS